jgi:hypothetical protein
LGVKFAAEIRLSQVVVARGIVGVFVRLAFRLDD